MDSVRATVYQEAQLPEAFSSESLSLSSESSRTVSRKRIESRSSLEHSRNSLEKNV